MPDDDEPVFKRSKWGTNRYVYNPRNPVGLALIVISLLFAVVMATLMSQRAGPFAPSEPSTSQSPVPEDMDRWAPPPGPGEGTTAPSAPSGP